MLKIEQLIKSSKPKVGSVRFIAIDGHGGSGKSSLADFLTKKLGVQVIRTDDFASPDNSTNWWPLVIEKVFKPISEGVQTLSYQPSKWWDNHSPEPVVDQPVADIMILEGVSSLRKEFRDYVSVGIFVDTSRQVCLRRGVERDKGTGKSESELIRIWEHWLEDEDTYLERDNPRANADIVVDGSKPFEEQLF